MEANVRATMLRHWATCPELSAADLAKRFDNSVPTGTLRQWRRRYGKKFGLHGAETASQQETTSEEAKGEGAVAQQPAAVWVDVHELKPWDRNPRDNDGRPVEDVMRSIQRFGFTAPILARTSDGRVIGGHTRIKAVLKLGPSGYPDFPMVAVRYLDVTDTEATMIALADNRTAEHADWSDEGLATLLRELAEDPDEDLTAMGWNEDEFEELLKGKDVTFPDDDYGEGEGVSGCRVEITLSRAELDDIRPTLENWETRGFEINIS